eukprot:c18904_g1_i1.p1 GENE.c18904_g1_i1~~c18904_g1_i1.p1  ORF type:complete len:529 (-),score=166.21 c18904_g1_i1:85-1671(-)
MYRLILSMASIVGTTRETSKNINESNALSKKIACQFLICLYWMNVFSLIVGKTVLYEILILIDRAGYSPVRFSLIATAVSVAVDFVANVSTSRFYSLFYGNQLNSKNLSLFALQNYLTASIVAFIGYGIFGFLIHVQKNEGIGWIIGLFVLQTIHYPFINQVADQSVQMGLPHWLQTFDNTIIIFPGFPLKSIFSCCCAKQEDDGSEIVPPNYLWNAFATAKPTSLSLFLSMIKYSLTFFGGAVYLGVRSSLGLRWAFMLICALINIIIGVTLFSSRAVVSASVRNTIVTEEKSLNRMIWQLPAHELSLVIFAVIILGVPAQALNAIVSLVAIQVPTLVAGGILVAGLVVFLTSLSTWMKRVNEKGLVTEKTKSSPGFSRWLQLLWGSLFLLAGGACILYFLTGYLIYLAIPLVIPATTLTQSLHAKYNGHLFELPKEISTDIQYWRNVLNVLINGPLLGINWLAVGLADDSTVQLGLVLAVTVAFFFLTAIYYTFIDPLLGVKSLRYNILLARQNHVKAATVQEISI